MKLAWLTDIHLNFLEAPDRLLFYQSIIDSVADAVLISGDIAEATSIVALLSEMADVIKKPIYFVAGNHDYYRGDVLSVHQALNLLTEKHKDLFWLPSAGIITLADNVLLLGQDGWADARLGDIDHSQLQLNDSRFITDLKIADKVSKAAMVEKMREFADIDAKNLAKDLDAASQLQPKKIIILTHIPPYKEACMHQGEISDDNWLPYFSAKATGDVLTAFASTYPAIDCLVLCGHTHSEANYQPLPNLKVKAGHAAYYYPCIQELLTL